MVDKNAIRRVMSFLYSETWNGIPRSLLIEYFEDILNLKYRTIDIKIYPNDLYTIANELDTITEERIGIWLISQIDIC